VQLPFLESGDHQRSVLSSAILECQLAKREKKG